VAVLGTVGRFVEALDAGDGVGAVEVLDEDWSRLDLPGLPFGMLLPGAAPTRVVEVLDFYGEVFDLEPGTCRVDPPRRSNPRPRVICLQTLLDGLYAQAVRAAGLETTVVFTIEGDRIRSIVRAATEAPDVVSFCAWVEETAGYAAIGLFDTQCWPVVSAPDAARRHLAHAGAYVGAGLPAGDPEYLALRAGAGVVDQFVFLHNLGVKAPRFFAPGEVAALPGFVGEVDGSIDQRDLLGWSATMYRIDLGDCVLGALPSGTAIEVVCPQATWSGPLLAELGVPPLAHPIVFHVAGGSIVRVDAGTSAVLATALLELCRDLGRSHPVAAAELFEPDCTPVYARSSAERLLALAAGAPP
jgi:hypothetical protein